MAERGLFLGINRYADSRNRELRGARRDAVAMEALFADSFAAMTTILLVDEDARADAARAAIERLLLTAEADDVLILFFAGHGSPTHRLVFHDSVRDRLDETTLGMRELGAWLSRSPARAVLCVLDCCFSGGAGARVLEDVPLPRDEGFDFAQVGGEGRFLLAAAGPSEAAWESPGAGHGLLTGALLDVLTESDGPVDVLSALAHVVARVRADAQRIGHEQTPLLAGHLSAGFTLPAMRRGPRSRAAFPVRAGRTLVTASFDDLRPYDIPDELLGCWKTLYKEGLNELQRRGINEGGVLDGTSLVVSAPTSAGKTFLGELAAVQATSNGKKAIFLLPYRALVNEKYDHFRTLYGDAVGLRVVRCTGDYQDQTGDFLRGRYDLGLLTYEMFLRLALRRADVLDALGLVVLDEAQFIREPKRGINVELLLTTIVAARRRGIRPQLLALSAVIGDANAFHDWLGAEVLVHEKRPVRLVEGVLDRSGLYVYRGEEGEVRREQLLPPGSVVVRRGKPSAQDVLVPLARKLVADGEVLLVFRNKRGPARGAANYVADELGLPPAERALAAPAPLDPSAASAPLRHCLQRGTAFHTTDLTREERVAVEQEFRRDDTLIRVVVSTSTLAAGINTPASTVVLVEHEVVGEEKRSLLVAEYKNMAGRAGRLSFRPEGRAILLAESAHERERLFRTFVEGKPEQLRSSFDPSKPVVTWLLRLLAAVRRVRADDVPELLLQTYGGYLASRQDPSWVQRMRSWTQSQVSRMRALALLEDAGEERIQLTILGRACGESSLSFDSCLRLLEMLRAIGVAAPPPHVLAALVQGLDEMSAVYTPLSNANSERAFVGHVEASYGRAVANELQRGAGEKEVWFRRCKRVALMEGWADGIRIEELEAAFTKTPFAPVAHGDILSVADATRFHLGAAFAIAAAAPHAVAVRAEEEDEAYLRRLQTGLPSDALELLDLPVELPRGAYLALWKRGLSRAADVLSLAEPELKALVGAEAATRIVAAVPRGAAPLGPPVQEP